MLCKTLCIVVLASAVAHAAPPPKTGADIQKMIDALPPSGGEVKLTIGTYAIASPVLLRSGVTLRGTGPKTILKVQGQIAAIANKDWTGGDTKIKVMSLVIDGMSQEPTANDWNVRGNTSKPELIDGVGIYLQRATDVTISQVGFKDCRNEAIFGVGASKVNISQCSFANCAQKNAKNDFSQGCVYMRRCSEGSVSKCIANKCYEGGFVIGFESSKFVISDNQISDSDSGEGVFFGASSDNVAKGNVIRNTSHADGGTGAGIAVSVPPSLDKEKNPAARNIVQGNTIEHTGGSGISVFHATDTIVIENVIRFANENKKQGQCGISVYECSGAQVQRNLCEKNDTTAIGIIRSDRVTFADNRLPSNKLAFYVDDHSKATATIGPNK